MAGQSTRILMLAGVMMLAAMAGCQQEMKTTDVLVGENPPADSAALAWALSQKTWCTNNEAASLVLSLVDGKDEYGTFESRMEALQAKGLAQESWRLVGDEPVTKGTMGFMLCKALGLKGGVMMQVLPARRYAYREALAQGLMVRGSEFEPLTGPEAVGILQRAALVKEGQMRLVNVY